LKDSPITSLIILGDQAILSLMRSGRILRYDLRRGSWRVLVDGLPSPVDLAVCIKNSCR